MTASLLQRLLTGTLLAVVVIGTIFFAPIIAFRWASAILILLAVWEFSAILRFNRPLWRFLYVGGAGCVLFAMQWVPVMPVLWLSVLWWIVASFLVWTYPKATWVNQRLIKAFIGLVVFIPTWVALNAVRTMDGGDFWLLWMLLLVWSVDTGAYFVGKQYGRHLLLPIVSPRKTKEGVMGGWILAELIAILGCIGFQFSFLLTALVMLVLIPICVYLAVLGDLLESLLKRLVGIKDMGRWLPGHGGLYDRIDSLTAVAPIFLLLIVLIIH